MKKEYNVTMGVLQCFAIFFVILGHMECTFLTIDNWFPYYSFHMPLFVFISGYFYDSIDEANIKMYIKRKSIKLLIPFYVWNCIYLLIQTFLNAHGYSLGNNFSMYNLIIWPWIHNQPIGFNVASWFIIALYMVTVLNCIFRRLISFVPHKEVVILCAYIVVGCSCVFYIRENALSEFYINIMRVLFLLLFFQMGYLYKNYFESKDIIKNIPYFMFVFILIGLLKINFGNLNYGVFNMSDFQPNILAVYASTFLGIAFWLRVSKILTPIFKTSSYVSLISKNTFGIMMHHLFAVFIIKTIIAYFNAKLYIFSTFDLVAYSNQIYYLFAPYWESKLLWSIAALILSLYIAGLQIYIIKKVKLIRSNLFFKLK